MAFEIFLKLGSFCSITKSNGHIHFPRPVSRCVRNFPGVVTAKPAFQVFSHANVMVHGIGFAHEKVYVKNFPAGIL